jgi:hypothetical protein
MVRDAHFRTHLDAAICEHNVSYFLYVLEQRILSSQERERPLGGPRMFHFDYRTEMNVFEVQLRQKKASIFSFFSTISRLWIEEEKLLLPCAFEFLALDGI